MADSQVSLAWIEALNKEFQTFVQNRVVEIRKKHLARKLRLFRSSCPNVFFKKRCSENMKQNYRITPLPKCDFNKGAKQLF